jgi:glucosamine--fructose-6-phosphate aminotransferase (isomerizing)
MTDVTMVAPAPVFLAEVAAQPAALRSVASHFGAADSPFVAWAGRWRDEGSRPIVLTGMGASLFALESANTQLALAGVRSRVIPTSDLLETELRALDDAFVVVVSQSGESTEVKELLQLVDPDRVHALTNRPDSSLARSGAEVALLGVTSDRSVALVTYSASLAALGFLAAELTGVTRTEVAELVELIACEVADGLDAWTDEAQQLSEAVAAARSMSIIGWGAAIGVAREAALLFKEAARFPAEGMSASQFRHGAVELVDERHVAVVFLNRTDPGQQEDRVAHITELAALSGRVIVIGQDIVPSSPRVTRMRTVERANPLGGLADIVPLQLLAVKVAARTGFQAGDFRNTTPVIAERPKGGRAPTTVPSHERS